MSEDETLPHITSDGWRSIHFEHFWDQVKSKKSILSTSERSELVVSSLSSAFAHSPQSMCSAILHRINSRAEVIPVFIRNATIWNRVYAEWTHFPYHNDENVALYSSIDSTEFLGQMLSSLLAGRRIISIDIHDLYGLVERVEQWKIMRLTTFPQLMYGIICTMVVIK
ncbi:hypothetical protein Ocin01_16140 [Orchesella cincta]|uniref:Uncharacterized protein n=1 Tax=Orchesella cincta TaxID=48709 RepID=A0A1D2MC43_ORCCI|nr:hypothetical protein Ocin01_16140 [Orchesella cincta]